MNSINNLQVVGKQRAPQIVNVGAEHLKFDRMRGQNGAVSALLVIVAFFILLPVGLVAFEVSRMCMAQSQLKVACDSAALAAATSAVSFDGSVSNESIRHGQSVALALFQENSILGHPMQEAGITDNAENINPGADQALVNINFDQKDRVVTATAVYGAVPTFAKFLGVSTTPIKAKAKASLAKVDLMIAVDTSISMLADTNVVKIKRKWDSGAGSIKYDILGAAKVEDLGRVGVPGGSAGSPIAPFDLTEAAFNLDLRARNRVDGNPPGNYLDGDVELLPPQGNPGNIVSQEGNLPTDYIVDVSPEVLMQSNYFRDYAYADRNLVRAVLVEASRGHLENAQVFARSKANTSMPPGFVPQAGYKREYDRIAKLDCHPYQEALAQVSDFVNNFGGSADVHFGFLPFSAFAGGELVNDKLNWYRVSPAYAGGGREDYSFRKIELQHLSANQQQIMELMPQLTATNGTDTGHALEQAINTLADNTKVRPDTAKVVLLFTDGQPYYLTGDGATAYGHAGDGQNARQAALAQADRAKHNDISIFSIGLLDGGRQAPGADFLRQLTQHAGGNSQFYVIDDVSKMKKALKTMARSMVTLVR